MEITDILTKEEYKMLDILLNKILEKTTEEKNNGREPFFKRIGESLARFLYNKQ